MDNYFPLYKNYLLIECQKPCQTGEDEKCLNCDSTNNLCSKCYPWYKLDNGKCIINYSLKAIYFTENSDQQISLFSTSLQKAIKEIIIDTCFLI